jgi:hypothetical protein
MRCHSLLLLLALCCAACAGPHDSLPAPSTHLREVVSAVTVTPAEVRAGTTAVLDFTVARAEVPRSPYPVDNAGHAPWLSATRGALLPLLPEAWQPGTPAPSAAAAMAALDARLPDPQYGGSPARQLVQQAFRADGHVYILFVAPAQPGPATLEFFCGAPDGDIPAAATRRLTVNVLP